MRIPPNLKYLVLFVILIAITVIATIYLPKLIPNIGPILQWTLIGGMGILILITFFKPFKSLLYARADGILVAYLDQSEKGFHLFTYHINSGGEYGPSSREIQHYYFHVASGQFFYRSIYSHNMEPVAGRSGWTGFNSFERTILPLPSLKKSLEKFSVKAGYRLQLGNLIQIKDDHGKFTIGEFSIKLGKFETVTDEGVKINCTKTATNSLAWKKKI